MSSSKELTWQATAAANILRARTRNGRLGARKSRSGCATCKIRRVKCDETYPECNKCVSTGRKCDGYAKPPSTRGERSAYPLIGSQLSRALGLSDKDTRPFSFFLSWTAPRLAGSLDRDFWCRDVLQYAHSEPLVLDAVLSIATLYEHPQFMPSFLNSGDNSPISQLADFQAIQLAPGSEKPKSCLAIFSPPIDEHHAKALHHYNKALSELREKIQTGKADSKLAILSCVLFICIELSRDNVFSALNLFRNGVSLLKRCEHQWSDVDDSFMRTIRLIFLRLGLLAGLWGSVDPLEIPINHSAWDDTISFDTAADARSALLSLMAMIYAFQQKITQARHKDGSGTDCVADPAVDAVVEEKYAFREDTMSSVLDPQADIEPTRFAYGCDGLRDDGTHHRDFTTTSTTPMQSEDAGLSPELATDFTVLYEYEKLLHRRLDQWRSAFAFIEGSDDEADSCSMMYYHAAYIWLSTQLMTSEMAYDNFTDHFEAILNHAEVYMRCQKSESLTFTFELGAAPLLFCVAIKCRMPTLRRRALSLLLRAPRKEYHFGSHSCAEIAARFICIEEEGMPDPPPGLFPGKAAGVAIPAEEKRIHSFELLKNFVERRWEVRIIRYSRDEYGNRYKTECDCPV